MIAELLTRVEYQWSKAAVRKQDSSRALACYGHASHIVEDFFFHSNFVEIAWEKINENVLPYGEDKARLRRNFYRRLRSPKATDAKNKEWSTTDSDPSNLVITGSFGAEDIFHTILDIFQQFGEDLEGGQTPPPFREILGYLTDPEKRKPLRDEKGDPRKQFLKQLRAAASWTDGNLLEEVEM